jgi:hypothetical protein
MIQRILSSLFALAMIFTLAAPAFAVMSEENVHEHSNTYKSGEAIQPHGAILPCCGADEVCLKTRWTENYGKAGICAFGVNGCVDNDIAVINGKKCSSCGEVLYRQSTKRGYYCPTYDQTLFR